MDPVPQMGSMDLYDSEAWKVPFLPLAPFLGMLAIAPRCISNLMPRWNQPMASLFRVAPSVGPIWRLQLVIWPCMSPKNLRMPWKLRHKMSARPLLQQVNNRLLAYCYYTEAMKKCAQELVHIGFGHNGIYGCHISTSPNLQNTLQIH